MKITVVTVARNASATIADTVKSVLSQDYPYFEHIIIDGASSDETLAIVNALRHPNMRVLSEPDQGLYDAMNKGLRLATGELIGFLNADDYFCRSDALGRIATAAAKHPNAAAISAGVAIVDQERPSVTRRHYGATSFRRWMLRFGHMPPHPGFYARLDAVRKIGEFDTNLRIGADFEWMVRFYHRHGLPVLALRETIVAMRTGGLSTRGLSSMRVINAEAQRSLAKHGIQSSQLLIWSKYAFKIGQFVGVTQDGR